MPRTFPNLEALLTLACVLSLPPSFAQEVVLVEQGDAMLYLAPATDPGFGLDWTLPGFADGSWEAGVFGVGYNAGNMIATTVPDTSHVVYTRTTFTIDDLAAIERVHFGADHDDGFVAYINGTEVSRDSMPPGPPEFGTNADSHESSNGDTADYSLRNVTLAALPALVEGENTLAVGVWNVEGTSSDLALVPFLSVNRPSSVSGTELCGAISGDVTLGVDGSPYVMTCDLVVPEGAILSIEAGVEILGEDGVDLEVQGRLVAEGSEESPILFDAVAGATWGGIDIDHANLGAPRDSLLRFVSLNAMSTGVDVADTGESSIILEDCEFDNWTSRALRWDGANGLVVRRCAFGMKTPLENADHETINGYRSSALVEHCVFGVRRDYNDVIDLGDTSWGGPVPTIRYNFFSGGDDDAIDFDGADGWIVGNIITNHRPGPEASSQANGGGITGEDSAPVVMNNIVYNCYHGIGYKNDSRPLIVNNLVIDCHVGVTFYKDECDEPAPDATLINNIVWNNRHFDTGEEQNLVLNGAWFETYCQTISPPQATVTASHNIIEGGWPGEGNLDVDPQVISPATLDFTLAVTSPAVDAGFGGPLDHPGVDAVQLRALLFRDRDESFRVDVPCIDDSGSGDATYIDLGPLEVQLPGPCGDLVVFRRGDSNGDGRLEVSDVVHGLLVLFKAGFSEGCDDSRDANDDGSVNISDMAYLLNYLFKGGPAPFAPFPGAGIDPTDDPLECDRRP